MVKLVQSTRKMALLGAISFGLCGGVLWGQEAYLTTKAAMASVLIERAYQRHLEDGHHHKPWSWADTAPIAKLTLPKLKVTRTILAGASGSSLAFGPGWVHGTAAPNTFGRTVITGHRDTDFKLLEHLKRGDQIALETINEKVNYEVTEIHIVSAEEGAFSLANDGRSLALVTCYPFGTTKDHGLRYIVVAKEFAG